MFHVACRDRFVRSESLHWCAVRASVRHMRLTAPPGRRPLHPPTSPNDGRRAAPRREARRRDGLAGRFQGCGGCAQWARPRPLRRTPTGRRLGQHRRLASPRTAVARGNCAWSRHAAWAHVSVCRVLCQRSTAAAAIDSVHTAQDPSNDQAAVHCKQRVSAAGSVEPGGHAAGCGCGWCIEDARVEHEHAGAAPTRTSLCLHSTHRWSAVTERLLF